jgi:F-type H+-transporting ATPase subunit delta
VRKVSAALVSRYARSLFHAALDANALEAVHADLSAVTAVWHEQREFALLVMNPRLSREKVRALLDALADRLQAHPLSRRFLYLLIEKKRLEILSDVGLHFDRLWRDRQGEIEVTVTTALPVSDDLKTRVRDHLARRSGQTPLITWRQDEAILGGLIVAWPDRVFDGSLSRKLQNLTAHLAQAVHVNIVPES